MCAPWREAESPRGCTQNVASIGELPTCIISLASPAAHVRPTPSLSLWQLFLMCYAPATPTACDAAVARGRSDALRAAMDPSTIRTLETSLVHGTPAALLARHTRGVPPRASRLAVAAPLAPAARTDGASRRRVDLVPELVGSHFAFGPERPAAPDPREASPGRLSELGLVE